MFETPLLFDIHVRLPCQLGMNSVFNEQILADKLAKLNTTQQCIETLSHWCIFHRSKAELVVSTWVKQFHKSEMVHKVPLLYLANDILQNSKRKGNEFVTEFWKVLPAALKDVHENGNEQGKSVVSRLVDIWEQRRVFGSHAKSLRDLMLGDEGPPPLELTKKRSRTVRIVKRDSRSIRMKLAIGGAAEKIVSAFHLVLSEHPNGDTDMSKCKSSVQRVRKMESDVEVACAIGKNPRRQILAKELEEEEKALKQCIEKFKSVEASRVALVSQLKEALHEQESELENIRTQMQVAESQVDEARNMRKRLNDEDFVLTTSTSATLASESNGKLEQSKKSAAAIAAEVADRLAASSSSQMIMTSVLSTFAAQEAKNVGLTKGLTSSSSFSSACAVSDSNSVQVSDLNGFTRRQQLVTTPSHSFPSVLVPQQTMQSQLPASQAQYHVLSNPSSQQYIQPAGVIPPYAYSNIPQLPPGPPPPPHPQHMLNSMVSLPHPQHLSQQHMTQHQQIPITQLSVAPNFCPIQPSGMVYYDNSHHSG